MLSIHTQASTLNFMMWASKFNKVYHTVEEFEMRLENFTQNFKEIQGFNKEAGIRFALNHMSDWTDAEYKKLLGFKNHGETVFAEHTFAGASNSQSVDWRDVENVVTPVKDQGACGSCWAFSTTEAVESAYVLAGNEQQIMAPQELVDCDTGGSTYQYGCGGGMYDRAYQWLKTNKTMLEENYPYTSGKTGEQTACAYDESVGVTNVSTYSLVEGNSASIMAAIEQQPVNVAICAENNKFRSYSSGILMAEDCCSQIDHAVVAVGYGYEGTQGYYIVRNSWAASWGEDGYVKIAIDDSANDGTGACAINTYVAFPTI